MATNNKSNSPRLSPAAIEAANLARAEKAAQHAAKLKSDALKKATKSMRKITLPAQVSKLQLTMFIAVVSACKALIEPDTIWPKSVRKPASFSIADKKVAPSASFKVVTTKSLSTANNLECLAGETNELEASVLYSIPYRDTEEWNTKAGKLVDFYHKHNICALPVPADKKLLLISKEHKASKLVYPWLNFLVSIGVDIYHANESTVATTNGKETKVKGSKFPYRYSDGYQNVKGHQGNHKIAFTSYDSTLHGNVTNALYMHEVMDFVAAYSASWMSDLSADLLAELFAILVGKTEHKDATVSVAKADGGYTIDFKEGLLKTVDKDYKVVNNVVIGGSAVKGSVALFMLGQAMSNNEFSSWQIKGLINKIPSMWEEDLNYGVKTDDSDPAIAIPKNAFNTLEVFTNFAGTINTTFPWIVVGNPSKKVNMAAVKACLEEEGIVTGDKYLLKFFAGRTSANAAMIGDAGKWVYTLHDAGKPSKLWNRPMQSCKFLKSQQYTSNTFSTIAREQSLFGTMLPNGSIVRQAGRLMSIGFSTSGLGMGSGAVLLRRDVELHVGVEKTIGGRISLHDFGQEAVAKLKSLGAKHGETKHHAFNYLKKKVAAKIEAIDKDRLFESGETILEINTLPGTKVIVKNDFPNVPVRIISASVRHVEVDAKDYEPAYFNVEFKVEAVTSTQMVKNRRYFTKNTTTPSDFNFYDLDGNAINLDVEMLFNNETIKGRSVHIDAFANTLGIDAVYYPNDGLVSLDGGAHYVDVTLADNVISQWVQSQAQDVLLELDIAKDEWEMLQAAHANKTDKQDKLTGIVSVVDHGDYVTVREQIQILVCKLNFEVEISTPDESISISGMTPEMTAGVSIQSRKLAEVLVAESKEARESILGLVNMVTKSKAVTLENSVNLNTPSEQELLANRVGSLDGLSDSKVLDTYKLLYPNGLYLKASNTETTSILYLDFDVIRSTMVWISGSADQMSQEIVGFLRAIINPPKTGYDNYFYGNVSRLSKSLNGWLKEAFASKGVLKRAARTSKCLVNLKVRTCYYTFLQSDADGIPKVAVNPNCAATRLLAKDNKGKYYSKYIESVVINDFGAEDGDSNGDAIDVEAYKPNHSCVYIGMKNTKQGKTLMFFNPYLLQGEFISAFRIPMFMGLGAKLVVTEKVGKSHAFLLPYLWSMANEGDTDGDGISLMNVGIRGLNASDINEMNESWVGLKGYKIVYGDDVSNWPYAEFSEKPKKKWLKWENEADKAKYCKPYVSTIPKYSYTDEEGVTHIGYFESGELVQKHYVAAVGIAYGIASALTFKLADTLYAKDQSQVKSLKLAVVIAWRALYEGLGLAGYSNAATKWFAILGASKMTGTYVCKDGIYMYPTDKRVTKDDTVIDAIHSLLFLGEDEVDGNGLSKFWVGKGKEDGSNIYYNLMYKAMALILEAERTRTFFTAIEKGGKVTKLIKTEDQLLDSYIYGGLRRMGQGADPAGIPMREAALDAMESSIPDEEEILPMSLFAAIDKYDATARMSNPWLKDMLSMGTYIHNNISAYLHKDIVSDREKEKYTSN